MYSWYMQDLANELLISTPRKILMLFPSLRYFLDKCSQTNVIMILLLHKVKEFLQSFHTLQAVALLFCLTITLDTRTSFDTRIFQGSQADTILTSQSNHFVIIVTSYNNQQWYLKNITSACSQEYDNCEIIFIDDCSADKTGELVEAFLENNPPTCKVTLIKNHTRRGAFQNIYRAISWCKPDDIIVSLDGDDWLADNQVLSHLNTVYSNKNVWMTHGQFLMYPGNTTCDWAQKMPHEIIKKNAYRSYKKIPTPLRTFYVWLFRTIKLEDLLHEGSFYPVTWDMAFMLPMMELSGGNHAFIDKILYIYNTGNPLNDYKTSRTLQYKLELKIRAKKRYTSIKKPSITQPRSNKMSLAVLITSDNNPAELELFIKSLQTFVHPLTNVYVVWNTESQKYAVKYQSLTHKFPAINFIQHCNKNFFLQLFCHLRKIDGYFLICQANIPFTQHVDLEECMQALENTQAAGCYFIPQATDYDFNYVDIDGHIKAWQFLYTPDTWKKSNPCAAILYKNTQVLDVLLNTQKNLNHVKNSLWPMKLPEQIGLFLES